MLSGSIGPQEQPIGDGRSIVYGESARNGVLGVWFNPPVQEGSIESLTRQQFSICTDLKVIPEYLGWVEKQIEKLKVKQHCAHQLPRYIHHLFFTYLCCNRFPDEAQKYLTIWQIDECKDRAREALELVCVHYGFNAKDLMDDIYNPESALWNQLSLVIEKESDSQRKAPTCDDEISREDLLSQYRITTQALDYRIKKMGHPKPIRTEGRKQWFSVKSVNEWRSKED